MFTATSRRVPQNTADDINAEIRRQTDPVQFGSSVGQGRKDFTLTSAFLEFLGDPGAGTRILGFFDDDVPAGTSMVGGLVTRGSLADLTTFVGSAGVRNIVVATSAVSHRQLLELYWTFGRDSTVELRLSSGLFEILTTGVRLQEISRVPLLNREEEMELARKAFKGNVAAQEKIRAMRQVDDAHDAEDQRQAAANEKQ